MIRNYVAYNDPEHGWLKVTRKELHDLGIAENISGFSYERGNHVYLEEDCDATMFINFKGRLDMRIERKHTNKSSKIRSYNSYKYRPLQK